ncbi:MAG: hypothetical protein Q8Q31_00245 [Nanoarchaeota archaeon]|nr:hypothetical protein [Nanoarchaeota archaeon]
MRDKDVIIIAIIVILAILFTGFPMMGFGYYGMASMMSGLGFGLTAFLFMTLLWILIIVALILFIIWLVQQIRRGKK